MSSLAAVDPCDLWLVQRLTRENRLSRRNPGHSVHMRSHDRSAAAPPQPKVYSFLPQDVWRACGCSREGWDKQPAGWSWPRILSHFVYLCLFLSRSLCLFSIYQSLSFFLSVTHHVSVSFFSICVSVGFRLCCLSLRLFSARPCLFMSFIPSVSHFLSFSSVFHSVSLCLFSAFCVCLCLFCLPVYLSFFLSFSSPVPLILCLSFFSLSFYLSFVLTACLSVSLSLSPPRSPPSFLSASPSFLPLSVQGLEKEKVIDQGSGPAGQAVWLEQTER